MRWLNEYVRKKRDECIIESYKKGLTVRELATAYNLSISGVKNVLRRNRDKFKINGKGGDD